MRRGEERQEYWRALIEKHSESDLSAAALKKEQNINSQRFYYWRKHLNCDSPPHRIHPPCSHLEEDVQLDSVKGYHIWAEDFDREIKDIFAARRDRFKDRQGSPCKDGSGRGHKRNWKRRKEYGGLFEDP